MEKKKLLAEKLFSFGYLIFNSVSLYTQVINFVKFGRFINFVKRGQYSFLDCYSDPNLFVNMHWALYTILPVLFLISASGVLFRKNWARLLFIFSCAIAFTDNFLYYFVPMLGDNYFFTDIFGLFYFNLVFLFTFIHIVSIIYFSSRNVREQFK